MTIKKNGKVAETFKKILNNSNLTDESVCSGKVCFTREKGVGIRIGDNISIYIKDETVDTNFCANGYFITIICAALEDKDEIEISKNGNKISVGDFVLAETDDDDTREEFSDTISSENPISFTKEQWEELEKDYSISAGNFFKSQKLTNVIGFTIKEGTLYKTIPNTICWKLSKFDATINNVFFEQNYGHTEKSFMLPKFIYNIVKGEEKIDVCLFSSGRVEVKTDNVNVVSDVYLAKTKQFNDILEDKKNNTNFIPFNHLLAFKNIVKAVVENSSPFEEDREVSFTFSENKGTMEIENYNVTLPVENAPKDTKYSFNIMALNYVFENIGENAKISKAPSELAIQIADDKATYFIVNN